VILLSDPAALIVGQPPALMLLLVLSRDTVSLPGYGNKNRRGKKAWVNRIDHKMSYS